jgi:hypothetical protein
VDGDTTGPGEKPAPGDVSINGRPATWLTGPELRVNLGNGMIALLGGDFSKAELIAIAKGLRPVSNPEKYVNWTDKPLG